LLLFSFFINAELNSQPQHYTVSKTPFSTWGNDEFSPVFFNNGIVYCSNLRDNSLIGFNDGQKRLFNIFYITKRDSILWNPPKLLSKELTTELNEGPVTFNPDGKIIYFSRNNSIGKYLKSISDTSNKLGIYKAELVNGIWTNATPFIYNNPLYNFCAPSIDPEGNRIYFSSDKPEGYGGMDIYYCERQGEGWNQPVNLGPAVNTKKNESFPFAVKFGKLYFASDGHKGFGGKDLYYTQEINGIWISPVHLDSAINSPYDDFGIVVDSTFGKGYFSSNRLRTDDIFSFKLAPVDFPDCDTIINNNYCYTFYDEHHQLIDTVQATYIWDFGGGIIRYGLEARHCFPGPGDYSVMLGIVDELTGDTIADKVYYEVKLENIEQAFIKSDDAGVAGKPLLFEGVTSDLKDTNITDFFWNFGDGFKPGGPIMSKAFRRKGEYIIKLGLLTGKDSLDVTHKICVLKKIKIN
jgi:hypothetical protein